jgi:hypothetical protein
MAIRRNHRTDLPQIYRYDGIVLDNQYFPTVQGVRHNLTRLGSPQNLSSETAI